MDDQPSESAVQQRLVKYMGMADVSRMETGEDFGGRLAKPLEQDYEWNWENRHIVDVSSMSEDALALLLEDRVRFVEVTGMDRIPVGLNQVAWRGMKPDAVLTPDAEIPEPSDWTDGSLTAEEAKVQREQEQAAAEAAERAGDQPAGVPNSPDVSNPIG